MAELPMDGARVMTDSQQPIQSYCHVSWASFSRVVRSAVGQNLGRTDPGSVKGAIYELLASGG